MRITIKIILFFVIGSLLGGVLALCAFGQTFQRSLPFLAKSSSVSSIDQGMVAHFKVADLPDGPVTNWVSRIGSATLTQALGLCPTNQDTPRGVWFNTTNYLYFNNLTVAASNSFSIWMAYQPSDNVNSPKGRVLTVKRGSLGIPEYLRWSGYNTYSWDEGLASPLNVTGTNQAFWMIGSLTLLRSNNAGSITMYGSANWEPYVAGFATNGNPASNIVFSAIGDPVSAAGIAGYLYELRVYNRLLTQAEADELSQVSTNYYSPWITIQNFAAEFDARSISGAEGVLTNCWYEKGNNGWHAYATNNSERPYLTNLATYPAMVFSAGQGMVISNAILSKFDGAYGITILAELQCDSFTTNGIPFYVSRNVVGSMRAGLLFPETAGQSQIGAGGRRANTDSYVSTNTAAALGTRYAVMVSFDYLNNALTLYTNKVKAIFKQPFQAGVGPTDAGALISTIGFLAYSPSPNYFNGKIERILIYNKALFQAEATRFYNDMQ